MKKKPGVPAGWKPCSVVGCGKKSRRYGLCGKHATAYKRFGDPAGGKTYRERGTGNVNDNGYIREGQLLQHRIIAEAKLGRPLLKREVVHHIDGNRANNAPDNLMVFSSQKEHVEYHRKMRALEACGNPEWRRCCLCKQYSPLVELLSTDKRFIHPRCREIINSFTYKERKEMFHAGK